MEDFRCGSRPAITANLDLPTCLVRRNNIVAPNYSTNSFSDDRTLQRPNFFVERATYGRASRPLLAF